MEERRHEPGSPDYESTTLNHYTTLALTPHSLEKTLMLGKMEGTRRRRRQRTRWLDSVLEAISMSLAKLREAVKDRRAWRALVHGVTKSRTRLNDNNTLSGASGTKCRSISQRSQQRASPLSLRPCGGAALYFGEKIMNEFLCPTNNPEMHFK